MKISSLLSTSALRTMVTALVLSRTDCNALYLGLPVANIRRLEVVQINAARLIYKVPRRTHVSAILRELHWLPLLRHIQFKALCMIFKAMHKLGPRFISDKLTPYLPRRNLQSKDQKLLKVPRFRLSKKEVEDSQL